MSATTDMLHRLWSKAVGTADYMKPEWMELSRAVELLEKQAASTPTTASDRERDLTASLTKLVAYLDKHGGYMSAQNQAALREAKALLAEVL